MVIFQIVPRLPPAIDGVGDYALNLACQLRQDYSVKTHFIVGDPTWMRIPEIAGFPTSQVNEASIDSLLSLLPSQSQTSIIVVLHYVGYGYARKGCPVWLIKALEQWKVDAASSLLVTMFHEVYASGPPWKSAFWLSPLQKNLLARLTQLSDSCLTSKQLYAKNLYELSRGKQTHILTLPVFSNIGELVGSVLPLAKRHRRLVVFGSGGNRLRVYQESLAELRHACRLLAIEEIWDIGSSTGLTLSPVDDVPVIEMGPQPAGEVGAILASFLAGFMNYDPGFLARSGIFAAYCAYGLLPVNAQRSALPVDGIEPGKHYWVPNAQTTSMENLAEVQAIATNAYTWYQHHNLSTQAKLFVDLLNLPSKQFT